MFEAGTTTSSTTAASATCCRVVAPVQLRFKQAVLCEDVDTLSRLLWSNAIDADVAIWPAGRSAVHLCSAEGLLRSLRLVLSVGQARVNEADLRGHTPVMLAGSAPLSARPHVLRLLKEHRADFAASHTLSGETALHYAVCRSDVSTVRTLVELGAPVDQANVAYETPLHFATSMGSVGCVESLVRAGADCNARDKHGLSPIYYLARYNCFCLQGDRERLLHLMVACGARIDSTEFWIDASTDPEVPVDFGVTKATLSYLDELRSVGRPQPLYWLARTALRRAWAPRADAALRSLRRDRLLPHSVAAFAGLL